ncbi:MAG: transcription-repair coupling factor [Syntrophales bacterium]|nr:transcription-repair coupling factor [Syntrophales bacterium]
MAIEEILERLRSGERELHIGEIAGVGKAFLVSFLVRELEERILVVCPTEKDAQLMCMDLKFFLPGESVFLFPSLDLISSDPFLYDRQSEIKRIFVLNSLLEGSSRIVVTSMQALIQRTLPRRVFELYRRKLSLGDIIERDELVKTLMAGGYTRNTLVSSEGEFSVRGYVVDFQLPGSENGIRLEFVGDEIESMRVFDPVTQRSVEEKEGVVLIPAKEMVFSDNSKEIAIHNFRRRSEILGVQKRIRDSLMERLATSFFEINPMYHPLFYRDPDEMGDLFSYLPPGTILVVDDPWMIKRNLEKLKDEWERQRESAQTEERFFLDWEALFLSDRKIEVELTSFSRLYLESLVIGTETEGNPVFSCSTELGLNKASTNVEGGPLVHLIEKIKMWLEMGMRVIFVCGGADSVQRSIHLLKNYGLSPQEMKRDNRFVANLCGVGRRGLVEICEGQINRSTIIKDMGLVFIYEDDVFGRKLRRRRIYRSPREAFFLRSFSELKEGDYVVHRDHGIGIFRGLKRIKVEEIENDFLLIEYAEGDKLFIPVDRLEAIQRYIGPDGHVPRVDRLGGSNWESVKERVKRSIREVAEELVTIYAAREALEREPYASPDSLDEEFAALFPYEETPDQAKAIEDVYVDMESTKPMDRLVCGDAGFGKTEVAIRAAFRAVMSARQVAVLVPTTVLAEQHYVTFKERFRNYPVRIEVLNRLRSKSEQRKIIDDLKKGLVDVVIGTHRLLQKDIQFRNLGLVIIDEEQRFGVAHKEKFKRLRTLVDVLTLTATPIPRTLHLSLVGIRDLSVINTAPEGRQPVKTYVVEFDDHVIREAIRRELDRGGQVFLLHDRVRSIVPMARYVQRLVPEAKVGVVHGQMKPADIESEMVKFIHRERDVLVCTTIIASGLDIPTANTIIVNRADRFGLSQLYQIRGRVGRSREEAYAYLVVPKGISLSTDAAKRLKILMEFSEPGSGFRIAASDLELRGAGDLLGLAQSGHVSAVGYELYTELMEKALKELRGLSQPEEEFRPEIHIGVSAFIPSDYVEDERQRLSMYKRISMAQSEAEIEELKREMLDCFGCIPEEVENLLNVIRIRNELMKIGGKRLVCNRNQLTITLSSNSPIEPKRLMSLARDELKGLRLSPDYALTVPIGYVEGRNVCEKVFSVLRLVNVRAKVFQRQKEGLVV